MSKITGRQKDIVRGLLLVVTTALYITFAVTLGACGDIVQVSADDYLEPGTAQCDRAIDNYLLEPGSKVDDPGFYAMRDYVEEQCLDPLKTPGKSPDDDDKDGDNEASSGDG